MKCDVLLFAHLAERIGSPRITCELPDGATVADLLTEVANQHEAIRALDGRLAVAVNERYESLDTQLPNACTVALIPPVSGG